MMLSQTRLPSSRSKVTTRLLGLTSTLILAGCTAVAPVVTHPLPVITLTSTPAPRVLTTDLVWNDVQQWRVEAGLPTYKRSEPLCDIAKARLPETQQDWSHNGFLHPTGAVLDALKAAPFTTVGENLARGFTEDTPLNAWLQSPSHKANLDRDYTHACIVGEDGYFVHIFGK